MKGNEMNSLHTKLTPYRESLEDDQRDDVDSKISLLKQNWSDLKNFVLSRINLIEMYIQFHHEAENLSNLFNNLEQTLKTTSQPNDFKYIDSVWSKIQIQFTYLKKVGKNFIDESSKVRINCCNKIFQLSYFPISFLSQKKLSRFFTVFF